jgi:hypothetical protein
MEVKIINNKKIIIIIYSKNKSNKKIKWQKKLWLRKIPAMEKALKKLVKIKQIKIIFKMIVLMDLIY